MKIDELEDWENFGAVIINDYEYGNEIKALAKLKQIARERLLILISSDDALFQKIQQNQSEFPKLRIIERPKLTDSGEMLKSNQPTFHYNGSPLREMWIKIRQVLEAEKLSYKESHYYQLPFVD